MANSRWITRIVQVKGDPVAVFEQGEALGVAAVLGKLQPDARLRRRRAR